LGFQLYPENLHIALIRKNHHGIEYNSYYSSEGSPVMIKKNSPSAATPICALIYAVLLSFGVFAQNSIDDVRSAKSREYAERLSKQIAQKRPRSNPTKKKIFTSYAPNANDDGLVAEGADVGITIWRLRPARKTDHKDVQEQTRIAVRNKGQSGEKTVMMVPARAESETVFTEGDLLKMSIEPPFESYIYIINREQYKDGSYSEPYLIFPARADIGTNDKGFPGRLLFLPSENDDDKFELTRLNPEGAEKVAEVFTIVLSQQPLKELPPLEKSNEPRRIEKPQFERWQNEWGGRVWSFERQGSSGASITRVEKKAGAKVGSKLTEDDPYPQTVYHVARNLAGILLFNVSLKIRK
jgi:hypothetical protein